MERPRWEKTAARAVQAHYALPRAAAINALRADNDGHLANDPHVLRDARTYAQTGKAGALLTKVLLLDEVRRLAPDAKVSCRALPGPTCIWLLRINDTTIAVDPYDTKRVYNWTPQHGLTEADVDNAINIGSDPLAIARRLAPAAITAAA